MTVRKIVNALKDAKKITLDYEGLSHPFDRNDNLAMQAYGDFVVCAIFNLAKGEFALELAMRPVREGEL